VDEKYRGHHLGERLMRSAIELARNTDGIKHVTLHVRADNPVAYRLYAKLGFVPVRRVPGYYSGQMDGIRMVLRLE
jgi:ribosomal-protein-alanine N-acetyltransferase